MKSVFLIFIISLLVACGGGGSNGDSVGAVTVDERSSDNNSPSSAQLVALNNVVGGNLQEGVDDLDMYKFELTGETSVTLTLSGPSDADFDLSLYSSSGTLLAESYEESSSEEIKATLGSGVYFVAVYVYEKSGNYSLSMRGGSATGEISQPNGVGDLSVYADVESFCIQFDGLTQESASVIVDESPEYEYGVCSDNYSYRCDISQDGINVTTYFTSEYPSATAQSYCSNLEGNFTTL